MVMTIMVSEGMGNVRSMTAMGRLGYAERAFDELEDGLLGGLLTTSALLEAQRIGGGEARLLAVAAMDYGKGQKEDKHVGRSL